MDLYRFYDEHDTLLYIGISLSAAARASQHKATQPWWHEVARMDVEHLATDDRREAERLERAAIAAEEPLYNVAGNYEWRRILPTRPLTASDTERAVYNAAIAVMDATLHNPAPYMRDDILKSIEEGVFRAVAAHLERHGLPAVQEATCAS